MSTPPRRRPTVPPLSELDAPGRAGAGAGGSLWDGRTTGPDPADAGARWSDRTEPDLAAQRAVAEERAAVARAVLAERAAAAAVPERGRRPLEAGLALGVAALLLAGRLWLVGTGALFGAGPVHALDVAVGVTAALGLALLPARPAGPPAPSRVRRPAVVLGVPVLVLSATTFLQPAVPAFAPAAACPAAPLRGGTVTAVTTTGTATRSGPGLDAAPSGLLPAGCAVGVTGYCLGDPLPAGAGWSDSRWLLVERQRGPAGLVSRHVSGEPELPRFLPAASATQAGPDLPPLPAGECGPAARPGPTQLDDVAGQIRTHNIAARAPGAANLGFALWVGPDPVTGAAPRVAGGAYRRLPGGAAGPTGRRTSFWDFTTIGRDVEARGGRVTVAVLAVGCTAPATPAGIDTVAVTTYEVVGGRLGPARQRLRGERARAVRTLDVDRLTAEACAPPV